MARQRELLGRPPDRSSSLFLKKPSRLLSRWPMSYLEICVVRGPIRLLLFELQDGVGERCMPYGSRKPGFRKANALITHTLVDFEKILAAHHVSTERWNSGPLCARSHGRRRMMDTISTAGPPTVALHGRCDHTSVCTLFHDRSCCKKCPAVPHTVSHGLAQGAPSTGRQVVCAGCIRTVYEL